MSTINKVHTPCKNCAFAKYEDKTQTDCLVGYIDKYKDSGAEILEVYDDEREFYVINSKKCIAYREDKWFKQYNLGDASIEEKIAKFKELNCIEYLLVVDMKNFTNIDLERIKCNINKCAIKPKKIIFIRYQKSDDCCKYENIKNVLKDLDVSCAWRIQSMLDEDMSYQDILHNVINMNKGYRFIASTSTDSDKLPEIVEKANDIVYNKLGVVIAMSNESKSTILFSASSYRYSIFIERKDILSEDSNYIIV